MGRINEQAINDLNTIALAIGMTLEDYAAPTRRRKFVNLRTIGEIWLRQNHSTVTVSEIARFYGFKNHTSVVKMHRKGLGYLRVRDVEFCEKYTAAIKALTIKK